MIEARLIDENNVDGGIEFFVACDHCGKEIDLDSYDHNIDIKDGERQLMFLHRECSIPYAGLDGAHKRAWTHMDGKNMKKFIGGLSKSPGMLVGAFLPERKL